jgi:hypothetical protein
VRKFGVVKAFPMIRQVLECGCPLPLSLAPRQTLPLTSE